MSWFLVVLLCMLSAEIGYMVAWRVFRKKFYEPQKELTDKAFAGWEESIKLLEEVKNHINETTSTTR